MRPPEIEGWPLPDQWEGGLIKGKGHASAVAGFSAALIQKTGVAIYLCSAHSSWQNGSHENIDELIRQHLPKGADVSKHSLEELGTRSYQMNILSS